MPRPLASLVLAASLAASPVAWAAKVGYFESKDCVDRSGMEQCYEEADEAWTDCINENCKDQNIDCHNVCSCIQTMDMIDCAGRHCWNQVYSCEYQLTAGDIGTFCLNPKFDAIPFYPPPDNAPGSCSCNMGKIITSLYRSLDELDTCGAHGEEIVGQFWEVCPNTDPSLLGADEIYQSLVVQDENWPQCAEYMEAFPCGSTLGFTPPGGDDSGPFYEPGNFPPNGTATTSNIAGSITSPVSGAKYTWTYNSIPRTVTVVSADSMPTATGEAGGDAADSEGQNQSQDGGQNEGQNEAGGNGNNEEDNNGSPPLITPGFFLVGGPLLLLAIMML
ncbi:hypothetical protein DL770_004628 [Monosporascus sp. CRB-9-2]|nr:hypothetical protein DL770_004628 [Monosporascus sp. CRB-9-2]